MSSAATTTAIRVGWTLPSGCTGNGNVDIPQAADGTASFVRGHLGASGDAVTAATSLIASGPYLLKIDGLIANGANAGDVQFTGASEDGGQVTFAAGATVVLTEIA